MVNSNNRKITILSKKYCVEKMLVDKKLIPYCNANGKYEAELHSGTKYIDIYLVPQYFKKFSCIKMILFIVENLFTGGSGLNKTEILNMFNGIHVFGDINDANEELDVDNNLFGKLKQEKYISKNLAKRYKFAVHFPMLVIGMITLGFIVWAFFKVLLYYL